MKKIIYSLLFFILSMFSFSTSANKGNYDETQFRQDVINYAMNNLGRTYSQSKRMQEGYFDCSSYVGRAVRHAGMSGGVNGNEGSWATTTDGMRGNVRNVAFENIKPGDTLNFSKGSYSNGHVVIVLENLGNGKFKIAHAGSPSKVQNIDVKTWRGGTYIGSISATQILINNGYTPVNSNGQVIVPPAGASVGSNSSSASLEQTIDIDFDKISNKIIQYFSEGIKRLVPDLTILLSILFAFELYFFLYEAFSGTNEKFLIAFTRKILKFVFYLTVLNNYLSILTFMYNFFLGIAEEFFGTTALIGIFKLDSSADGINLFVKMLLKSVWQVVNNLNNWTAGWFNPLNYIFPAHTINKLFMIVVVLAFLLLITVRYILEIFIVKTQFFLAGGLSLIFLPFEVFEKTKNIGSSRTLRTLITSGVLITTLAITGTICYEILNNYILKEAFFDNNILKTPEIFYYLLVMYAMLKILTDVRKTLSLIMR